MLKTQIKPVSRKSDLVTQELGSEILIYDLTANKAFNLNESSALIWQLCDGNRTISDIARNLTARFDAVITEDFVWLALEQLKKDNLLENAEEVSNDFDGLSRREVIRKVGFATLVALPLVSSLIAPTSVNANSTVTCSGSCQCPNATVNSCSPTVGTLVNCNTLNPTATCRCRGPFGAPGSGQFAGQKLGNCATA